MLTYFSVKNYKNFKREFWLELRTTKGDKWKYLSKFLITGETGVGKSNLCRALIDVKNTFTGSIPYWDDCEDFLNANSNADTAEFHYGFRFKETNIDYSYVKLSQDIIAREEMRLNNRPVYTIDFRTGKIFIDEDNLHSIGPKTINTTKYPKISNNAEIDINPSKSFLRWLVDNTVFPSDSILMQMSAFIMKMDILCPATANASRREMFTKGVRNDVKLNGLERFLNEMGVECTLMMKKRQEKPELCFAYARPIPFFPNASSGTAALCMIYDAVILSPTFPSVLIVDELDSGLSEETAEKVCKYLAHLSGQVIFTTNSRTLRKKKIFEKEIEIIRQ